MLNPDGIREKLTVMAHQENNNPRYHETQYIRQTIDSGRDIVRSNRRYRLVPIDASLPRPLVNNPANFYDFIRR
jgi:hypothetical protein